MKKKLAVFFGGRSTEHDISVITAVQAMGNLDRDKYEVYPVYMKSGVFYTGDLLSVEAFLPFKAKTCRKLVLSEGCFYIKKQNLLVKKFKPDCALICCHGGEGENGVLQGVLEYNRIPYTGCGVTASAVGMDKALQKELIKSLMLNVVSFISFRREEYRKGREDVIMHLETFLDYPMIIKPNSLGSSIGIKLAYNKSELADAIEVALAYDDKAIAENALTDFTEVNCAVFTKEGKVILSEIERPLNWQNILTFEDKYIGAGKGMENCGRELPAKISPELYAAVHSTTEKIYTELGLEGVVRVDFMIDNITGKLYVNEFNTVPGSLSNYLFETNGISYTKLLDCLIAEAESNSRARQGNKTAFSSNVLKNLADGRALKK